MIKELKNQEDVGNTYNKDNLNKSKFKGFFFDWVVPILGAIILAQLINKFLLFKVSIPTESMAPTVEKGDQLFVTKVYDPKSIKRGDIVVFKSDEFPDLLLKRVIGLPGDKIEINAEGKVFINGTEYKEDYVKNPSDKEASFQVPDGKYVMLGDNRARSNDARYWNNPYIDGDSIEGIARIRVYPLSRIGSIK